MVKPTRRDLLKTGMVVGLSTSGVSVAVPTGAQTQDGGTAQWTVETGNAVFSSPTVADDTVFVGSGDNRVYALDADDGTEQWQFETGAPVISSLTVADDTVFVGSYDNRIYALSADDGTEQWQFETGAPVVSSPTVADTTVFVGSGDNAVYALDAGDGTEQWQFETGDSVASSPTVADGTVYIGSGDNAVYALDAGDGTEQWQFETGDSVGSSPTVADNTVYVGSTDNRLYALSSDSGTEQWQFETGDSVGSSPTVAGDTVYIGSGDNALYALSADDGTEQWQFETGDLVGSSPTVADDTVFVGSHDNRIYALSADDGTEQWSYRTGDRVGSSPTVVEGTLFVGSFDDNIYALDAGVSGSSAGSRTALGTLGHHSGGIGASTAGTIQGTVLTENNEPVADVDLTLVDADTDDTVATSMSDQNGEFTFELSEAGTYELTAEKAGYRAGSQTVTVGQDETASADIVLQQTDIGVAQTRADTTVKSPVTVQVTEPPADAETYVWRVVETPSGSEPTLLHGSNYQPETQPPDPERKSHAVLRPDVPTSGEEIYRLEVTVKDGDGSAIAYGNATVEVTRDLLSGYGFTVDGFDTAAELVEAYAPNYHFPSTEVYFPTRYEAFVENAELRIPGADDPIEDITLLTLGDESLDDQYTPSDSGNELFLPTAASGDTDGAYSSYQAEYPPTIHANVTDTVFDGEEYIAVTYWAFYLFDSKKGSDDNVSDTLEGWVAAHASDLETVTVLFSESGPEWVAAAQHYSGEYLRWEKAAHKGESDRLDIYPANGAHSSFLVNTQSYDSYVPLQYRWLSDYLGARWEALDVEATTTIDSIPTTETELADALFGDVTASDLVWSSDGTTGQTEYDLVVLPDEQSGDESHWTRFGGTFNASEGRAEGQFPQQTTDGESSRWDEPGEWIPDRLLSEPTVLNSESLIDAIPPIITYFETDTLGGAPSAFVIRNFHNPGKKPHTLVAEADITTTATGETTDTVFELPLGWDEWATISIPLDDIDMPDTGAVEVAVDVVTYPEDVPRDSQDTIYSTQANSRLNLPNIDLGLGGTDTPDREIAPLSTRTATASETASRETNERRTLTQERTVTVGDAVSSSVTVTNNEEASQTVLITLSTEDESGVTRMDGPVETREITLGAGESRDVELSWTVTDALPEGTYDLITEVWLETDPEARTTQLGSQRSENGFVLEKPRGELSVTASPEDGVVTLDGEVIGETPLTTEVATGTYDVTVVTDGYEPVSQQVSIEETEPATVTVTLQRIEQESGGIPSSGSGSDQTTNGSTGGDEQSRADGTDAQTPGDPATTVGENGAGFGVASALAGLGGLSYLLRRRQSDDQQEETDQR